MNYGTIGAVIGHEITHAFDDEGRKFDAKGNLKDWWTKEDAKRFEKSADILRKQYDAFVAVDDVHVNGSLTLGENIADLGGVLIAYDAFVESQKGKESVVIDGFTREQRFFIGLTLFEASHCRKEMLKQLVVTDPHSPAEFRINGPVVHADCFYGAFDVTKKDRLYIDPSKRARIW
jgi:putative endopeptidase